MKPKIKKIADDCFDMKFSLNEVVQDGEFGHITLSKYDLDGVDCDVRVCYQEVDEEAEWYLSPSDEPEIHTQEEADAFMGEHCKGNVGKSGPECDKCSEWQIDCGGKGEFSGGE